MRGANPGFNRPPPPRDEPSPWPTQRLPLADLKAFVGEVLVEMVKARDVSWDAKGRPVAKLRASKEDDTCSWCHFIVDFSAIGMPTNTELTVSSREGDSFLIWYLGRTPLVQTPKGLTPAEAAATMDMDTLLAGHRRLVAADAALSRTSMSKAPGKFVFIDPDDGSCSECDGGHLEIIAADEVTMTVACAGCGHLAEVEHDAFDDGLYLLRFLDAKRERQKPGETD